MKSHITILLLFFCIAIYAQVDTIQVQSTSMSKSIKNVVITPDSYDTNTEFPVVYLLHGAGGDYSSWIKQVPQLQQYANDHQMIIVCPDGGRTSWYWDSPIDEKMQYETYVSKELISAIDSRYKTIATGEGRAITGLSMGGHGAFFLAIKHQDVWGAAGSQSGGVDIRPFPNNWDMAKRLGEYSEYPENWEKNTVINMLHLLSGRQTKLKMIFECGTGDFFYDGNKRLHQKMLEMNIPHDYTERPGVHNWDYWRNSIKYQLLFFSDFFAANR
jgi:S-formylglutathione hydrolase FrmB